MIASADLMFKHTNKSNATVFFGTKDCFYSEKLTEYICLKSPLENPHLDKVNLYRTKEGQIYSTYSGGEYHQPFNSTTKLPWIKINNIADIKNWILRNPNIKGTLIETKSGIVLGKFHTEKPHTARELFDLRFDRQKVKTTFKEWLWDKVYARYIEM